MRAGHARVEGRLRRRRGQGRSRGGRPRPLRSRGGRRRAAHRRDGLAVLIASDRAAQSSRSAGELGDDDGPDSDDPSAPLEPFKEAKRTVIDEFERAYLARLLARAGTNISRAASLAGIERQSLRDLLKRHGLRGEDDSR
ncbi:MAG: hypothetical protein KF894_00065 [Labilithrix sp.]|nr:hypothetical protein [Labilithrix sp.]